MKYILYLYTIVLTSISFSQIDTLDRKGIEEMFDDINKSDATHIGEKIRDTIFIKNFNSIIELLKTQGYPTFPNNRENKKLNQSIENGTRITFVHILQTNPTLLLNKKTIDIISKEVYKQKLDSQILKHVLSIFQYDQDRRNDYTWNKIIENNFYLAIREWDIKLYPKSL